MQPVVTGVISDILKLVFKIIFGVLKLFSLAVVYALVGVVLYLAVGFNPFNGNTYSTLYIIGFVLAVIASLLLAFRKKGGKKEQKEREEEKPVSLFARLNERKRIKADKEKDSDYKARTKDVKHPLVEKLFNEYAPKYAKRAEEKGQGGGYTRILKLGARRGDAAEKVILELVD